MAARNVMPSDEVVGSHSSDKFIIDADVLNDANGLASGIAYPAGLDNAYNALVAKGNITLDNTNKKFVLSSGEKSVTVTVTFFGKASQQTT
jgi:hypothetical protein